MKTLLTFLLLLMTLNVTAQINEFNARKTENFAFSDSTGFYVLVFTFNDEFCSIPLTNPPGCPHYDAEVSVYKITGECWILLGEPFPCTYTKQKCYEDNPAMLVRKAKVLNNSYYKDRLEKEGYGSNIWDYINDGKPLKRTNEAEKDTIETLDTRQYLPYIGIDSMFIYKPSRTLRIQLDYDTIMIIIKHKEK